MWKKIVKYLTRSESLEKVMSFEQKIEAGHNSNFHGNNKVKDITIGKYSYVSFNSIVYYADIGNYCSLGPNVVIGYGDHPTNLISTSPHVYLNELISTSEEIETQLEPHFKRVKIENDVWIGSNVYIKNGIRIGNGAIVGAGAIVIKDVEDYEIVAGVPAKHIRKRFDEEIIQLLNKSKWWELEPIDLVQFKSVLFCPEKEGLIDLINFSKK